MPKLRKHNLPWKSDDLRRLRALAREGKSARESAPVLGRTVGSVKYKAMTEGIRFHFINQPQGVQKRIARRHRRR